MKLWNKGRISPAQIIMLGFGAQILTGTLLLMLPISTRGSQSASFLDALFTAVSATCVTGLIVHDTYTFWSEFGQGVILILIQAGGMGVVTMAIAVSLFTGKRIGLKQRFVMQESISAPQMGGIVRLTGFIIKTTLILEAAGALLLALRFCPQFGFIKGLWYSIFHSISSFCNAGFDLMGTNLPNSSLTAYVSDPVVNLTIMLLITIGGIGFFVWIDLYEHKFRFHTYRLQTKLVLTTSAALLVLPAAYFYFYEFGRGEWSSLTFGERLFSALFQTVTPRTAGYNTVDLSRISSPSVLIMTGLMLIGGSPGSTAGGFKTTTLATMFSCSVSVFKKRDCIQCFKRRIPPEILRSASTILSLYVVLFLTGGILITCLDGVSLSAAMFESASALGTVGLTLGITGDLSTPSRLILIFLMYFGRVGGLTMIYALAGGHIPAPAQMPQERITVG